MSDKGKLYRDLVIHAFTTLAHLVGEVGFYLDHSDEENDQNNLDAYYLLEAFNTCNDLYEHMKHKLFEV